MADDEQSLTMEQFDINVGRFIEEIEKRRPIWDTHCLEYNNRDKKARSWAELVELFGDFGDCDENDAVIATRKKETEFILQKKWKNIRTCFTRDLRLHKKNKNQSTKNRYNYKYFTKLQFLSGVTRPRTYPEENEDTDSDAEVSEIVSNSDKRDSMSIAEQTVDDLVHMNDVDDQLSSEEWVNSFKAIKKKTTSKKPKLQLKIEPDPEPDPDPETSFIDMNSMEHRHPPEEHDEDKLFLLSLLSTMRRVPKEKKMTTRIKIMTVLNEATQATFRYGEASSNTYDN